MPLFLSLIVCALLDVAIVSETIGYFFKNANSPPPNALESGHPPVKIE